MDTTHIHVPFIWKQGGNHVLVAGSFSSWKALPMVYHSATKLWSLNLDLAPWMTYQFKFIVDGNWCCDLDLPRAKDSSGNTNNTIYVTPDTAAPAVAAPAAALTASAPASAPTGPHSTSSSPPPLYTSVSCLQNSIERFFLDILKELGSADNKQQQQQQQQQQHQQQDQKLEHIAKLIQLSKNEDFQFSLSCYQLSQVLKKKPDEIAKLVATKAKVKGSPLFSKLEQGTGEKEKAMVNFNVHSTYLSAASIGQFLVSHPESESHINEDILVEFSSPNTNKPQHLGHVRNNCLGDAISRMLKYRGYNVHKINLVNDRGVHICKSMLAYKKFGKGETPQSANIKGDHLVGDYYVVFDKKLNEEYSDWLNTEVAQQEFEKWKQSSSGKRIIEKNERERKKHEEKGIPKNFPTDFQLFKSEYKDYYTNKFSPLGIECNQMLVDWEAGKEDVRALWQMMNDWVFDGFKQTYERFHVEHDTWEKESDIYEYGKQIVQECYEKGILQKDSNGCIVCDLVDIGVLKKGSGEECKKVLLRSNGTSVYMTQDVGTAARRLKLYNNPSKLIYVVACEQDRHFQILFKLLENLFPSSKGRWYHLSYGLVMLPSGRMKSREGTVVDADCLADHLKDLASTITKEKWPDLLDEENKHRAEVIGMAALKFYVLSFGPGTEVTFDPNESLSFTGKSGPYLLYQYARSRSIFKKAGENVNDFTFDLACLSKLVSEEEQALLVSLYQFPRDVQFACDMQDPSKVVDSIYGISQYFNAWYRLKDKHQVVNCQDPVLKKARLLLVLASACAIKTGLYLLGIETLEQM